MRTLPAALILVLLAAVVNAQVPSNSDYTVYLALQYANELRVDQAVVDQIASERTIIETEYPEMADLGAYQEWDPGRVLVALTDEGWAAFMSGGLQEVRDVVYDNGCFVAESIYNIKTLRVISIEPLHAGLLADLFGGIEGVRYSLPDMIGIDGSGIEALELGAVSRYLYTKAWDCSPMGCASKHYWEFTVSGTEVLSVEDSGTVPTVPKSWGSVKALYR